MSSRILDLDPETHRRHAIHSGERIWAETNCYVDVLVELAHAMGHEPIAALPFTLAIDFEGDQWTFFKFPPQDLLTLFGLDIQELAIWRPLFEHIQEQVERGRPVLVELDSYYLPDTAGTAYRTAHVKSTVAVMEIDAREKIFGYFHNQGYYRLRGDDFLDVLRLRAPYDPAVLAPYVEFVKPRRPPDGGSDLVARSLALLRRHLEMVPATNPFVLFRARFQRDLDSLLQDSLETFHQYSFATLRQFGACYELSATYLRWLEEQGETGLEGAALSFLDISQSAKAFQFQLARAMTRRKPLDLAPIDAMAERWEHAIALLRARYH